MNKNLKYVLYVILPLFAYFLILLVLEMSSSMAGGCNTTGVPFSFYEVCSGDGRPENVTHSWNAVNILLDLLCIYIITGLVFYFVERHKN